MGKGALGGAKGVRVQLPAASPPHGPKNQREGPHEWLPQSFPSPEPTARFCRVSFTLRLQAAATDKACVGQQRVCHEQRCRHGESLACRGCHRGAVAAVGSFMETQGGI